MLGRTVQDAHESLNQVFGDVRLVLIDETGKNRLTQPEAGWKVCAHSDLGGKEFDYSMYVWVVKVIEPCDEGESTKQPKLPSIGDSAEFNGISVTLKSVSKRYSNFFGLGLENDHFLVAKFKLENPTSRTRAVNAADFYVSSDDSQDYLADSDTFDDITLKSHGSTVITIGADVSKSRWYQIDFLPDADWGLEDWNSGVSFSFRGNQF
jgi:hypothetical protein